MPDSGDEFDALSDDFADIDWNAVPDLNGVLLQTHADESGEEEIAYDDLPDPFTGIDWDTVPALSAEGRSGATANGQPSTVPEHEDQVQMSVSPNRPESAHSSTQYSFDEVDGSFLEEVDALESTFTNQAANFYRIPPASIELHSATRSTTEGQSAPTTFPSGATVLADSAVLPPGARAPSNLAATTSSARDSGLSADHATLATPFDTTPKKASKFFTRTSPSKRKLSDSPTSTTASSPRKKSKDKGKSREKVEPFADVKQALAGYEDELTCPICYDFLAASHLGNPCGHTFCGECGWNWISKHKSAPTCAICREKLVQDAPMIPNFAMDNTIERHLATLAASGHAEWVVGGARYTDWLQRKESWKGGAAKRAADARRAAPPPATIMSTQDVSALIAYHDALDVDYASDDDDNDERGSEDESDSESDPEDAPAAIPPPVPVFMQMPVMASPGRGGRGSGRGQYLNGGRGGRGGWRGRQRGNGAGYGQDNGWRGRGRGGRGGSSWRGRSVGGGQA